jgi:hypothetical protein
MCAHISRRTALTAGVVVLGAPLFPRAGFAFSGLEIQGCCLRADQHETAASRLAGSLHRSLDADDFITSSGNSNLDRYLGRALLRLASTFDVYPGFGFVDDRGAPNAYAMRATLLPGTRGTVLFGVEKFRKCMNLNDQGSTAIAICAHEYGHILQFETNYHAELMRGRKNVKLVELHADYLAGFFLGGKKRENPNLPLQAVGRTFEELGDTNYRDRKHHGSSQERITAIEAGYFLGQSGSSTVTQAAAIGAAFVRRFS